jgi:hypothetical protein
MRDNTMKYIKVVIDRESGEISVENDGKGIPVEIHETEGVYVPQMVFGELLTGDNYDDGEDRVVGGRNGYGAKLANIFSTRFEVATCDKASGQIYKQGKSKAFVGPVLCLGCCVRLCLVSNTDLACVFLSHPSPLFLPLLLQNGWTTWTPWANPKSPKPRKRTKITHA